MNGWRDRPPTAAEIEAHAKAHQRNFDIDALDPSCHLGGLWVIADAKTHDAAIVELDTLHDRYEYFWSVDAHGRETEGSLESLTRGRSLRFRPVTAEYEPCDWPAVESVEAVSTAKPRGDA